MSSDELTGIAAKAAQGGVFLFVGNTSATVILAIGSIIIARLLGPSSFGLYTLTFFIPSFFGSLSDAGVNYALVRLPAKLRSEGDSNGTNRTIRLGFLFKVSISLVAFLVCYIGAEGIAATLLNRPELVPFLRLASFLIVFQAVFDAATNSFIGLDLMQYSAAIQILYSILKSVLAPALILLGFGLSGAVVGYVLGILIAGVTGGTILFTKRARSTRKTGGHTAVGLRVLLRYSLPLHLATILTVFLTQYQNLVLAQLATDTEIGNFNAAWNFNMLMMILAHPITTAVFPMFSKMDPRSQTSELARAFKLAVKYTSMLIIPASLAIIVFSRDLVYLTYGRGYVLAPQYLVVVSAQYLLTGISYLILSSFLNGVAETGTVVRMSTLALMIYLPVGPALTWLLGPYGLVIAFILSNAASTLYGVHQTSTKFNARPDLNASGRILLAASVAAVPAAALVQIDTTGTGMMSLIIGGAFYLVAYLTLAPVLGAIDKSDMNNLEAILCKTRIVATLAKPIFDYEAKLLSVMRRK